MDENNQPDPELGSELRQTAGKDWSEEAAEDERLTEVQRRRRLGISEVIKDLASRGDRVNAEFGGHTFGGAVESAGDDYATIVGQGQVADVRFDAAVWSFVPSQGRTEATPTAAGTFRALLHEYSAGGERVRLALPHGEIAMGVISVVATDHIELKDPDARLIYVPFELILGIIRAIDFQ